MTDKDLMEVLSKTVEALEHQKKQLDMLAKAVELIHLRLIDVEEQQKAYRRQGKP